MVLSQCNTMNLASAAKHYAEAGMIITPLIPESKAAKLPGWNLPDANVNVEQHWGLFPADNIGLILAPSGICVLDIDCKDEFLIAIKSIGLTPNYDASPFWETNTAGIRSGKPNKGKLLFKVPKDVQLTYHKLQWNTAGGGKHTVFELRAGYVQDVLPPSIHPDTKQPYQWVGGEIQPMPDDLLLLWQHWETFALALEKADRLYQEPPKQPKRGRPRTLHPGRDIIAEWKESQNLGSLLEYFGYRRIGKRYLSPNSHSGTPGVILSDDAKTFYAFNESDVFADGHQHNAFDLMLHYRHHGDIIAAINQCKDDLGIHTIKDPDLLETARRLLGGRSHE